MCEGSFDAYQLSDEMMRALALLKYSKPTEVQSKVIPKALEKQDLIVKSQTGTGKTAAFCIPLCEMIDQTTEKPQALILTPTRELAVQVGEDCAQIGRFKKVRVVSVYGKEPLYIQEEALEERTYVIVGTPGRVMDHIERGTILPDEIKYLIIDEADEMLSMGFVKQVEAIIKKLPVSRITMVFSATFPNKVENLCQQHMNNPVNITINSTSTIKPSIKHAIIEVKETEKITLLIDVSIIENPDSCMIFCKTKRQVDKVFADLEKSNYTCEKIHSGIKQEDRFSIMDGFKIGNFRYLVATDVAARGIDLDNLSLVINYDIPFENESYVHRTGRTGRAGNQGKAITFIAPNDGKMLKSIESFIGFEIPKMGAPTKEEVLNRKKAFEKKMKIRR